MRARASAPRSYSAEFLCLRELIQNADDAGARTVRVHLERDEAPGASGQSQEFSQLRVANDGRPFGDADWQRLRAITSRGADDVAGGEHLGVGFFSVFALTDAPEIHSGSVRLRFRSLAPLCGQPWPWPWPWPCPSPNPEL